RFICAGAARAADYPADALAAGHRAVPRDRAAVVRAGADAESGVLPRVHRGAQPGALRDQLVSAQTAVLVLRARAAAGDAAVDGVLDRGGGGGGSEVVAAGRRNTSRRDAGAPPRRWA